MLMILFLRQMFLTLNSHAMQSIWRHLYGIVPLTTFFCPSCWQSNPPPLSHMDSYSGLPTGILVSSCLPYNLFSTKQLEGAFKTHTSDHVTPLLKSIQSLPIGGNCAGEALQGPGPAYPHSPSPLPCPHLQHPAFLFLEVTNPLPGPDFAGEFFSQPFRCLVLLHPQASGQLHLLRTALATSRQQPWRGHHDRGIHEHFTLPIFLKALLSLWNDLINF